MKNCQRKEDGDRRGIERKGESEGNDINTVLIYEILIK